MRSDVEYRLFDKPQESSEFSAFRKKLRKLSTYAGGVLVAAAVLLMCSRGTEASWTPESRQEMAALEETKQLLAVQLEGSGAGTEEPLPRLNGRVVVTYVNGEEYLLENPALFPAQLSEEAIQRGVHPANIFVPPLGVGAMRDGRAEIFLFETSEYPENQAYTVQAHDQLGQEIPLMSLMQASGDVLLYGVDESGLVTAGVSK